MALQFILGSVGNVKAEQIYNNLINEAMKNPGTNYILLVPEQYSMLLQRKIVTMHPMGGTMNIDVFGFNRLTYRVFDELNFKPKNVLEDFGKSMMLRCYASQVRDKLKVYGGCLDKPGFIDEAKSLMSELYQYGISNEALEKALDDMPKENNTLYNKLSDMVTIFKSFNEGRSKNYIVAEELAELLAGMLDRSLYIKNSVIVMDGFTGFTPIQLEVVKGLMLYSKGVSCSLTIDSEQYSEERLDEQDLFYLTSQTIWALKGIAVENEVEVLPDIFVSESGLKGELSHLEKNIFRYPYSTWENEVSDIEINEYLSPIQELKSLCTRINSLVRDENYRYKDIAVVTGDIEGLAAHADRIFDEFDIPYFLDYSKPVNNNPFIDSIGHAMRIAEEDFSYESVFAFLKSGVIAELSYEDIEKLENYVLEKGIRGFKRWNSVWNNETDYSREIFIGYIEEFHTRMKKRASVSHYATAVMDLTEALGFEDKIRERRQNCEELGDLNQAGLYDMLYDRLSQLFDKMIEIMGDEEVELEDFGELINVGLKDLSMGIIPTSLDMVIVGDITRTRLPDVKVLFMINMNDGVIPKYQTSAQIISDRDKDELAELGIRMAPTDKTNSFIQQFYIYLNITKPTERLVLSYVKLSSGNEAMRPSYIISRIKTLFPKLSTSSMDKSDGLLVGSYRSGMEALTIGVEQFMEGNLDNLEAAAALYRLYQENGEGAFLNRIIKAAAYRNIPEGLAEDVAACAKKRLMYQSVSKLEKFARCEYAFFLQYTLGLKERKIREISKKDVGIILHGAMEKLYRYVHDELDNDWTSLEASKREEITDGFVYQSFEEAYGAEALSEKSYVYLRNMLARIGRRTSSQLFAITGNDRLKPEYFEYHFSKELAVGEHSMVINGIVDRGDIFEDTNDISLRVIDYKSGRKEFRLSEVYEGVELQLAVYMSIMTELVEEKYRSEGFRGNINSEGMYYYQMRDPFIEETDAVKADIKREKELKLRGPEYDGSTAKNVTDFAMNKARRLASQIFEGRIDKNPLVTAGGSPCEYCSFKAVCRFDERYGGNKYRYPRYGERDKDTLLTLMNKENGGSSDGMD